MSTPRPRPCHLPLPFALFPCPGRVLLRKRDRRAGSKLQLPSHPPTAILPLHLPCSLPSPICPLPPHLLTYTPPHPCLCCSCRHEIDKLTASQRLDMNLEKG